MTPLTAKSLTKDIDQFLVFKHALGYPYRRGEATLRSFQRFASQKLERNATIDLAHDDQGVAVARSEPQARDTGARVWGRCGSSAILGAAGIRGDTSRA